MISRHLNANFPMYKQFLFLRYNVRSAYLNLVFEVYVHCSHFIMQSLIWNENSHVLSGKGTFQTFAKKLPLAFTFVIRPNSRLTASITYDCVYVSTSTTCNSIPLRTLISFTLLRGLWVSTYAVHIWYIFSVMAFDVNC